MKRNHGYLLLTALALLIMCAASTAQEILLDKMEQVGDLTCFQSFDDEKVYYYLPDQPRISVENGKPQFSFLKFVTNAETTGEGGTTGAQGGGIVHFLCEFDVSDADVRRAEQELGRRIAGARIAGPIIYRSGTFALVSSVVNEDGEYESKVVGLGKAPVMEGHKAAVSILLSKEGATLLWETFKSAAPDISLQFEMTVAGYREPFEAELEGDWSLIAKNKSMAAGLRTRWLGVDIQKTMKELTQENAIRLVQKGGDEQSDKLLSLAYGKLVEYIFELESNPAVNQTLADDPDKFSNFKAAGAFAAEEAKLSAQTVAASTMGVRTPPTSYPAATRHAATKASSTTTKPTTKPATTTPKTQTAAKPAARANPYNLTANKANPPSFSLLASYRVKQFKTSGTFKLTMNKFMEDKLAFPIAENVGNIYGEYGDDPALFREVNLDDPVYKQRELIVFLDGQDADDFANYINYVTVSMRKEHGNGDVTVDELKIDRNNFQTSGNNFRLLYGWKSDNDRDAWLQYQYKTHWSFHGGAEFEGEWENSDQFGITVTPPHEYRRIDLEADPDELADQDVRLVTVNFYYTMFGKEMTRSVSMRNKPEELNKCIEYTHLPGDYNYEYEILFRLRGNKSLSTGRMKGSEDIIFCDELPEGE